MAPEIAAPQTQRGDQSPPSLATPSTAAPVVRTMPERGGNGSNGNGAPSVHAPHLATEQRTMPTRPTAPLPPNGQAQGGGIGGYPSDPLRAGTPQPSPGRPDPRLQSSIPPPIVTRPAAAPTAEGRLPPPVMTAPLPRADSKPAGLQPSLTDAAGAAPPQPQSLASTIDIVLGRAPTMQPTAATAAPSPEISTRTAPPSSAEQLAASVKNAQVRRPVRRVNSASLPPGIAERLARLAGKTTPSNPEITPDDPNNPPTSKKSAAE